jgi:type 1 fimbriae regulatory protein FimB
VRNEAQAEIAVDNRAKNFLTEAEIASFLQAARKGRHGVRNYAMALLAYRHGLRVSELISMRLADVDLDTGHLFVRRLKGSLSTNHPLDGTKLALCDDGCADVSTRRAAIRRWFFSRSVAL